MSGRVTQQRLSNRERERQRRKHRIFYRDMRGIGEDEDENDEDDDENDEDDEENDEEDDVKDDEEEKEF